MIEHSQRINVKISENFYKSNKNLSQKNLVNNKCYEHITDDNYEKPTEVEPIYHDILEQLKSNKNGDSYDHLQRNPISKTSPHYQVLDLLI
ncbi:unnamed protein product [Diamesa serratosioi]